jgi:hypothetical protein
VTGEPQQRPRRKRHKPDSGDKFQQMKDAEAWFAVLPRRVVQVFVVMWNIEPGTCDSFFASHTLLARRAGIDRAAAVRATQRLCALGLVRLVSRGHSGGRANVYRIPAPLPVVSARTLRAARNAVPGEGAEAVAG